MSGFGTEALRAGMHGVTQGGLGAVQGDNFFSGFASGAISSIASSGFQSLDTKFSNSKWGGTSFGALSGGVGAELSGGDFWRGAGVGATVSLLNHFAHDGVEKLERKRLLSEAMPQTGDKFYDEKGNLLWDTKMEGKTNVIRVIQENDLSYYKFKLACAKDTNTPNRLLSWARENSIEYKLGSINSDTKTFSTYAKRGTYRDVIAFAHFFGEGFASGYGRGFYNTRSPGLANHYSQQFGARETWANYYSLKTFKSWW